ncbi:dynein light chain Tctex-type 5-like [Gigantopelta aegis]|uniref:dynein light chain Tctex-type 5-like n=1 Tax=Gigantopelta aegis TaxID=1735272 RepID=UPI001B88C13D|nr:dynein light chain Tctex-type 5-like [Gigantopelta aegis]XP_041360100.1 dynein light chain Tctex-type 5-like [Gigantopelta aegis]XP_041360101.1 dynein light chain Tctex-type 5-like [Gigantopelta aegis]XP_041360102.1 dynein light chain Tctex-type 5-like [Gigantopelta aegis]
MSKLTVENLEELDHTKLVNPRRMSHIHKDMDGMMAGPYGRRMSRIIEPRPSMQYGASGRRMSQFSRSSISGISSFGKNIFHSMKMQNTYRMTPDEDEKFNASKAERVMSGVLESYLDGEKYDKLLCVNLTKNLSEVIKDRMKEMGFSMRYKYVCTVTLGENLNQGLAQASRSIWNTNTDNFASASYSKGNLFAVATIYATYFE